MGFLFWVLRLYGVFIFGFLCEGLSVDGLFLEGSFLLSVLLRFSGRGVICLMGVVAFGDRRVFYFFFFYNTGGEVGFCAYL